MCVCLGHIMTSYNIYTVQVRRVPYEIVSLKNRFMLIIIISVVRSCVLNNTMVLLK